MRWSHVGLLAVLTLSGSFLLACGIVDTEETREVDGTLIYGSDNRIDAYQATTATQLQMLQAEVMLTGTNTLTANGSGYAIAPNPTYDSYIYSQYGYHLCSTEPYRTQPAPGFCSGFMVGPDLIATAGHCVTKSSQCAITAFVFGFHMQGSTTPTLQVSADDVYFCSQIVARVQTTTNDWEILRTNRPIVGHRPVPIRRTGTIQADWNSLVAELAVVGHPVGMPVKVADSAQLMEYSNSYYFQSNLDVYGGNSGSAVFSLDSHLGGLVYVEGILVRGNPDFAYDVESGHYCIRSNVCPDSGCTGTSGSGWEEVTRSTRFAQYVPACGDGLCGADEDCADCPYDCGECVPVCPDGNCNGTETCETCPDDCGACPYCGDLSCNDGETCETCPDDCGACPYCGDQSCNNGETCETCPDDCGECPTCAPKGAYCSSNSDCCSNNCRIRTHTCR